MFINIGFNPSTWFHSQVIRSLGTDKAYALVIFFQRSFSNFLRWFRAMKRDAKTVAGWDFERIIPCHGVRLRYFKIVIWNHCVYFILYFSLFVTQDVIETNAKQTWRDAYKYFLDWRALLIARFYPSFCAISFSLIINKPARPLISLSINRICLLVNMNVPCPSLGIITRLLRYRGKWLFLFLNPRKGVTSKIYSILDVRLVTLNPSRGIVRQLKRLHFLSIALWLVCTCSAPAMRRTFRLISGPEQDCLLTILASSRLEAFGRSSADAVAVW